MAYLSNSTRVSSLTIGGVDYTNNLISWAVSDASANKNGCISTSGSLTLGTSPGGALIEDYDRNNFKRGLPVVLEITEPGGSSARHPRGLLYVISTTYDVEKEVLDVEIACRLSLMALTDEISELQAITPVTLDIAQQRYENCCAAFASVGKYVYQDNQGDLQTGVFFDGDTYSGTAPGQWVSVLGLTAESVRPMAASGSIPDEISLSYQVPADSVAVDNKGRVDITTTESYYFINYPIVNFVRQNSDATASNPNGSLSNIIGSATTSASSGASGACGNAPSKPGDNGTPSCNEGYQLVQSPLYLPAYRVSKQETRYDGPGAQVSTSRSEVRGPRIEANNQYFVDSFAYCRQVWGTACQPNGGCPYDGMDEILLSYVETTNYYGNANELVRQIQDTYVTVLSAAQTTDWRAGNNSGVIQDFDSSLGNLQDMYRQQRRDTRYSVEDNVNIQVTDTYISLTSRGVGIKGGQNIDALAGVKTTEVRKSATISTLDVAPDIVNSATTTTSQLSEKIRLFTGRFTTPPEESGPYILEEQIPVPLLFDSQQEIDDAVAEYSNYLTRFVKGDIFGLQIGESLRSEVASSWFPGMPFRYYDEKKGKVLAMRMDATSWGVDVNSAAFVTNGVWIGVSDGTVTKPDNLVGNSLPDMGSGVTPPTTPILPGVSGETYVDGGTYTFDVDVHFMLSALAGTSSTDGVGAPPPKPQDVTANWTTTCWVSGIVVAAGDLLAANSDGSIPLDNTGSLVVAGATVVTADLFA